MSGLGMNCVAMAVNKMVKEDKLNVKEAKELLGVLENDN